MADPAHVKLVRQGADAIAKWREENPEVQLDLAGADLRAAFLQRADLTRADLRAANLGGAYLGRANLAGADLRAANLAQVRGAEHVYGLETVRFIPAEGGQGSDAGHDASYLALQHGSCDQT
jgi:hypothetical protein